MTQTRPKDKNMSPAENKQVVQNWLAARNSNNLEAALACWTDENHEWLAQAFRLFTTAFSDIHVTINEMVAEGDKVVVSWTLLAHNAAFGAVFRPADIRSNGMRPICTPFPMARLLRYTARQIT